jgi:hypothetical protein
MNPEGGFRGSGLGPYVEFTHNSGYSSLLLTRDNHRNGQVGLIAQHGIPRFSH